MHSLEIVIDKKNEEIRMMTVALWLRVHAIVDRIKAHKEKTIIIK